MQFYGTSGFLLGTAKAVILSASFAFAGCSEISIRDEFTSMVTGKSEAEVIGKAGKPSRVERDDPSRVRMIYTSRTIDLQNYNKRDKESVVIFTPAPPDGTLRASEVVFR